MTSTIDPALVETGRRAAEIELARRHFRDFLPFVRVSEPGVGRFTIQQWDYVQEVLDDLESHRLLAYAKARQIGFTTLLAAYILWHSQFVPEAVVLTISKGQVDAYDFLSKARKMYDELPPELQRPIEKDTQEFLSFKGGGEIRALPSTTDAGRGKTPTLAIMDEADFHPYLVSAYNAVKPGQDDIEGQLILTSTINPYEIDTLFQQTYHAAPGNGFKAQFYGWDARPGRTPEWYEARRAEYQDQARFVKEFPANEEEAFAPVQSIAAFDLKVVQEMVRASREPLRIENLVGGVQANIWREYMPGRKYVAATDTSHGVGKDDAVTLILDVGSDLVVADIVSNTVEPKRLAEASVELLNTYDAPIWAIEDNDRGIVVINAALDMRYRRLYYRMDAAGENQKPGWHTHDSSSHGRGSRHEMWEAVIDAFNRRNFTIFNRRGVNQFATVIRNVDHNGRVEAQKGARDDYPMALGIAHQIRGLARVAGRDRGARDRETALRGYRPWTAW